jgi:hypothetical protein
MPRRSEHVHGVEPLLQRRMTDARSRGAILGSQLTQ